MTNTRRANRNIRNARRQGEADAFNRLATILEHLTNPPLTASITNNYISVEASTVLNQSETPSELRTKEPKRKKRKSTQNNAITTPTPTPPANPNYTYSTQSQPKQTPTPKPNRKEYAGPHPLCINCTYHHLPATACRLCTQCNRLGHFATNCRAKPLPANTANQTPKTATSRACYECGDPNHLRHACPKLRIISAPQIDHNRTSALTTAQDQVRSLNQLTATTVPTSQQDQAPEL